MGEVAAAAIQGQDGETARQELTLGAARPSLAVSAPQAMNRAEAVAEDAWRRIVREPLAVYACRAEAAELTLVGGAATGAVWLYRVRGYLHAGTIFRGHIYRWKVEIDAQTGMVVGVAVDPQAQPK
jgi:hypothetical protein